MRPLNVLLTGSAHCVPLVHAFRAALHTAGVPGSVIVADATPLSPPVHVADRAYQVPLPTDPSYLEEIRRICEAERVRLLVPTLDDELPIIGAARDELRRQGVLAACSSAETAVLCQDKWETCRYLRTAGVSAARTLLPGDLPPAPAFPLFITSRVRQGGAAAFPVHSARELDFFLGYVPNPVVQEYLSAPEYAIDVLCDFSGRPLSIVPCARTVDRGGAFNGRTVNDPKLIALAEAVCAVIRFAGPLAIRCRMRGKTPAVFEITPRFSASVPLTIQSGADFPRMLVRLALGGTVAPSIGAFQDGLWITSYESSFFLELERVRMRSVTASHQAPGSSASIGDGSRHWSSGGTYASRSPVCSSDTREVA